VSDFDVQMDLQNEIESQDFARVVDEMQTVCRCCLAENRTVETMMTNEEIPLLDYYRQLSNVVLDTEKDLANVCKDCAGNLKAFWSFRQLMIDSNQKFNERLSQLLQVKEEELSDDDGGIVYETAAEQFSQVFVQENNSRHVEVKPAIENDEDNQIDADESFQNDPAEDSEQDTVPVDVSTIEAIYLCFYCDGILNTHKDYLQHRDDHIKERSSNRLNRRCHLCNEDVVGYFRHLEDKHRDYRPNICKLCPNGRFQSQNSLKNHLYSHTDNSIYKCLACKKTFSECFDHKARTRLTFLLFSSRKPVQLALPYFHGKTLEALISLPLLWSRFCRLYQSARTLQNGSRRQDFQKALPLLHVQESFHVQKVCCGSRVRRESGR
jgi:Zinc-finger associated domain (zf-AD)